MNTVTPAELKAFAVDVLVEAGTVMTEANATADVLVWSDHRGRGPQGTVWLETIVERLLSGGTMSPAPIATVVDRPALVTLDAGSGLGYVAATAATDLVTERASEYGLAGVTIRNSTHFGACGYYAARLADRGLLGIAATNSFPKVAPHGGAGAVLGTNPIGYAVPTSAGQPIIGDLSTGSVAGSRVREAIASGQELDPGVALDSDGAETLDPLALSRGGVMLPMGGPKGTALGLLIEILTSVLGSGAGPTELGSMFSPGTVAGTSHFIMAVALPDEGPVQSQALAEQVRATSPQDEIAVRVPGDAGHVSSRAAHVELGPDTIASLERVGTRVGVPQPNLIS